jgi:hypothetical protein
MATFREALEGAVRSAYCTITAPLPATLGLAGAIYKGLGAEVNGEDLQNAGGLVRNARNLACNAPPEPNPPPDFTGGQCPGTQYQFRAQFTVDGSNAGSNNQYTANGPISQSISDRGDGGCRADIFDGDGNIVTTGGSGPDTSCRYEITDMQRTDGQPDNCGNPGPSRPPYIPENYTLPVPIDFDDNTGSPITIAPDLTIGPIVPDFGNGLSVPITINFESGSSLFGDFNISDNTINFGIGGDGGTGQQPGEPEPNPDPGGPDGEEEEGDEGQGRPIIAVLVVCDTPDNNSEVTEIPGPSGSGGIWVPRLASVSFRCEVGDNRGVAWTSDIDVKLLTSIIPCPVQWGAVSVRVVPRDGVNLSFTPIRGVSLRELAEQAAEQG